MEKAYLPLIKAYWNRLVSIFKEINIFWNMADANKDLNSSEKNGFSFMKNEGVAALP